MPNSLIATTTQISHGDTAKEIGEIVGRYTDGIAIRQCDWGIGNAYINAVADASRVPVSSICNAKFIIPFKSWLI